MVERYHVGFAGPRTTTAAVEHLERQAQECLETLLCLRRAESFGEYLWLVGEREEDEVAQVQDGGTFS